MPITTIKNEGAFDSTIRKQVNDNFALLATFSSAGILMNLGTLSAAATLSAMDANGTVTITGANSLRAGQFIVMSNGGSAVGIFLNGVMVQVTGATAGAYTFNFGQGKALTYASAADTLKYQVVQINANNQLQAQVLASPITGVLATANLITITQPNSLVAGQFVLLIGPFVTASKFATGAIVQVASATSTSWTANWQGTIIAQTSTEAACQSALLVTNGGIPIASYPQSNGPVANITNSLAVAAAATAAGLLTLTAAQAFQPGMIIVVQNVGTNTQLNRHLGVDGKVVFGGFLPIREVAELIANSDLAVVPKRANSVFGTEAASTKIMEFMAVGVPVIVSRTKIDSLYHSDSTVRFFDSDDPDNLAREILCLYNNPALRKQLVANAFEYVAANRWGTKKAEYLAIVDRLAEQGRRNARQNRKQAN